MEKETAWLLLYAAIASMNEHPGTGRGDSIKLHPGEVADLTTQYLEEIPEWVLQLHISAPPQ